MSAVTLLYILAAVGCVYFAAIAFAPQVKERWLRTAFLLFSAAGMVWAGLGFYMLFRSGQLTDAAYHALYTVKATAGGIAVGLLILLGLSPEFWSLRRRKNI